MDIAKVNILGQAVKTNDEMVSLTDLWKASGGASGKSPKHWRELESTQLFVKALAKKERVGKSDLFKIVMGRTGGTYAHWQVALAYAKYLSPEMHMAANAVFRGYVNADPAMAASIIQRATDKKAVAGLAHEAIKRVDDPEELRRLEAVTRRKRANNELNQEIKNHQPSQLTFAVVANRNNVATVGMRAKDIKEANGMKPYASSRDAFSIEKMTEIAFREQLQMWHLKAAGDISGHKPIIAAVDKVNADVSALIALHSGMGDSHAKAAMA